MQNVIEVQFIHGKMVATQLYASYPVKLMEQVDTTNRGRLLTIVRPIPHL